MKKPLWKFIFIVLLQSLCFQGLVVGQTANKKVSPKAKKTAKKEPPKKPAKKEEPKLELVERIRLVLQFGNTAQVRSSLSKIHTLKSEADQKSLIPQLKDLLKKSDGELLHSTIIAIGELPWKDLDSELVHFLDNENTAVVGAAANAINKKHITQAIDTLKEKISKIDYTVSFPYVNDVLNAYASFKDPALKDFIFEKIKDKNVLLPYKTFMAKYLSVIPDSGEIKDYFIKVMADEKEPLDLRIDAIRALSTMKAYDAKQPLHKLLERVDAETDVNKKRENFTLSLEIIATLVTLKDETVKYRLMQMARDDDERTRLRAIRRLGELKEKEFIDLLEYKKKYDTSTAVQRAAADALDSIRGIKRDKTKKRKKKRY